MANDLIDISESREFFGPLYMYILDESITDIDINGALGEGGVWLTDCNNTRRACYNRGVTKDFIDNFSQRVSNLVSKSFNKLNPVLEGETSELRITIVHESVSISGRTVSIRKTPKVSRLTAEKMLAEGYCNQEILQMLEGFVRDRLNIVVVGEPGVGKTELCKYLSGYIRPNERVVTIEDTPEWHYSSLFPDRDCVEIRINEQMGYCEAIKTCMRLNPKWIMLSEARSREVVHLIESLSTGVRGMTTIHTSDVRNIPDRIENMSGGERDARRMENDIYTFIDVGILVRRKSVETSAGTKIIRYIDQICIFDRVDGVNYTTMLVDEGRVLYEVEEYKRGA